MTKVLIGVDGSDRSEDAVAFGRALALAAGAPVVLSTAHQTEPRQPRLHARVRDTPGVYAAGDATDFGIKQGGIACQQADVAAEAIAAAAGAPVEPSAFAPVLRALLVTEYAARWLHHDLSGEAAGTSTADRPPEDPPWTKISGRELSRHLTPVRHR